MNPEYPFAPENRQNCFIGGDYLKKQLYGGLKQCIRKAERIDVIVSFLRESGTRLLIITGSGISSREVTRAVRKFIENDF